MKQILILVTLLLCHTKYLSIEKKHKQAQTKLDNTFLRKLMKEWSEIPQENPLSDAETLVQLLTTNTVLDRLINPHQEEQSA